MRTAARSTVCLVLTAALAALAGCQTKGQTGLATGAGVGAIMGQAIGRDTQGTLIGTAIGAGVGYIIGNEIDKAEAREEQRRREALRTAPSYHPPPAAEPPRQGTYIPPAWPGSTSQMQPLADTTWRVLSMSPPPRVEFLWMTVTFQPNGLVVTTKMLPSGQVLADSEQYRIVGNTLIVNDVGYLTNATWTIEGNRLMIVNQEFRTVLERVGTGN